MSASAFIWYELLAEDGAAAARFYAAVLGWSARDSGLPGPGYQFFSTGECDVGGLMTLAPGAKAMGARPQWLPYLSVPDVDATAASVAAAGGAVLMPPSDIPGTGRFAMVADPQGAAFYVMAPIGSRPSPAYRPGVSGHGGWHELHSHDWRAARGFYAAQFGWGTVQEMDLGAMGTYLQFGAGERERAGGDPGAVAGTAGGKLDGDVHQVPGDDWILRARDPQGVAFALLGPRWEKHRAV